MVSPEGLVSSRLPSFAITVLNNCHPEDRFFSPLLSEAREGGLLTLVEAVEQAGAPADGLSSAGIQIGARPQLSGNSMKVMVTLPWLGPFPLAATVENVACSPPVSPA